MTKIRVGVVGPGTIGHKSIWALEKQKDMEFIGAAKTSPDWAAKWVIHKGHRMYAASREGKSGLKDAQKEFEETLGEEHVGGTIEDLVAEADVILDCSGNKIGQQNKELYYEPYNRKAKEKLCVVFQGGEKADVGKSFSSRTNYGECVREVQKGQTYLRCVSCNTTTLARFNGGLVEAGHDIEYLTVSLLRRSLDPGLKGRMILDNTEVNLKIPSHHAPDLQEVMEVEAYSRAYKVPVSLMHVHDLHIIFREKAPSKAEVLEAFKGDNRVAMLEKFSDTAELKERTRRLNKLDPMLFPGGDIILVAAAAGTYHTLRGNEAWMTLACPQDSIVVPENIDAVRALKYDVLGVGRDESMELTDKSIGLPRMKCILEESYAH